MIQAELVTQYPNLGGEIGHEAKVDETAVSSSGNMLGVLKWPTDSTIISSEFGHRNAPTSGASTNHKGIDISVGSGTNVYACASGTVSISQYSDSAGNYVVIDHGNGYVSKYMHNSSLKVSAGDQVQKGQVIALSGSTGISTGPHLHFQIEKDGTKYKANILTNFELYNNHYCIYTIPSDTSKNYNVYCAKIIENNLVKIEDEQEIKLTNKIVTE